MANLKMADMKRIPELIKRIEELEKLVKELVEKKDGK